jgi:hypothetical protein
VLISILTAWHGGEWTLDEVRDTLSTLFSKEYQLTQTVETETRYRTETRIGTISYTDPDTGQITTSTYTYEVQVPYTYTIYNVKLHNEDLSHLPISIMNEDQVLIFHSQQIVRHRQENRHGVAGLRLRFGVRPLDVQGNIKGVDGIPRAETELGSRFVRIPNLDLDGG